jgi:hypothetical protein
MFDAVHTHSYDSLAPTLRAAHGHAAADCLLATLTSINLRTNTAFGTVIKIYSLNTVLSCLWLLLGGAAGYRSMLIIAQSAGYALYTLYNGYAVTRACLPPQPPPPPLPPFLSLLVPPPEGPLAVSLLLTEFLSFNVLDPLKAGAVRDMAAAAAAVKKRN